MSLQALASQLEESTNIVIEMLKDRPRILTSAERLRLETLLMRLLTVVVTLENEIATVRPANRGT